MHTRMTSLRVKVHSRSKSCIFFSIITSNRHAIAAGRILAFAAAVTATAALTLLTCCMPPSCDAHPAPSLALCHGLQLGHTYRYSLETMMIMNNGDGREPTGYGLTGTGAAEVVWETTSGSTGEFLLAVSLPEAKYVTRPGAKFNPTISNEIGDSSSSSSERPLYAHIRTEKDSQEVVAIYIHQSDPATIIGIKRALINLFLTKKPSKPSPNEIWSLEGQRLARVASWTNEATQPSLFSPQLEGYSDLAVTLARDHAVVEEVVGWENVTMRSRIYPTAHAHLHLTLNLKKTAEDKSSSKQSQKLSGSKSIEDAVQRLGEAYVKSTAHSQAAAADMDVCRNCKSLQALLKDYEAALGDEALASTPATIAYLKLLERIRSGGAGAGQEDILTILKKVKDHKDVASTLLDVLAGARTESSIQAALNFLSLQSSSDLDSAERFLASLAASVTAASKMGNSRGSVQIIVTQLLQLLTGNKKWASGKLRSSTVLTLGTTLKAYNRHEGTHEDDLNRQVITLLTAELGECPPEAQDCRIVAIHALGNGRNLQHGALSALEKWVSDPVGARRESVSAMKAVRDCLTDFIPTDEKMGQKLRQMFIRVVYDPAQETTSRILAAELLARQLQELLAAQELAQHLPNFGNFELATMIYNKALKESDSGEVKRSTQNWLLHATMFNGSSAAYTREMGGTQSGVNMTYEITMELMSKGKLLKESSFDVNLQGPNGMKEQLFSVNLFARGLQSMAGGDDAPVSSTEGDAESTSAGMALRLLNSQLRPYTFFTGTGELMGHVWSGTASDPTPAFQGHLLISDHWDSHPLINGFPLLSQMRGVLSTELTGEVQISLWNRNSHSVVRTRGAGLFQASLSLPTTSPHTWAAKFFSFGGASSIDFITDLDFYSSPFKMCMQITQPEFVFRHNTRKYEQVQTEATHRRIHRRNVKINAKSYALHKDNNEMCSIMNE